MVIPDNKTSISSNIFNILYGFESSDVPCTLFSKKPGESKPGLEIGLSKRHEVKFVICHNNMSFHVGR